MSPWTGYPPLSTFTRQMAGYACAWIPVTSTRPSPEIITRCPLWRKSPTSLHTLATSPSWIRQVRKFNNLLNKKEGIITREGSITWQSSHGCLAARASSWAVNNQQTVLRQAGKLNSQAGRLITTRASPQTSQADSTLPPAESTVSQAGNSQASLADNTLPQTESAVSWASISQASQATLLFPRQGALSPRLPWQITLFPR